MMPLPPAPFDACDQATGRVSSQALVRYKTNDYSVPVAYGYRDVWVRGYVDEVIMPHSTRRRVARALRMLRNKDLQNPWKKHDNIPL